MRISIVFAAMCLVASALAQTTMPTTQPTTRPVQSIEEIVKLVPKDAFPAKGEPWKAMNGEIALEWSRSQLAGRAIELELTVSKIIPARGGASARVLFAYNADPKSGIVRRFKLRDYEWQPLVEGEFDARSNTKLAKLHEANADRKVGDKVRVFGSIKHLSMNGIDHDAVQISLTISDCSFDRPTAGTRPSAPPRQG